MKTRPTVLLVEDDATDETLARQAIIRSEIDCNVLVARDGREASHLLFDGYEANGADSTKIAPLPSLILLELDLPEPDGFELLTRFRSHPQTKRLPVVVFCSSDRQADIDKSFDLHANSYVHKDSDPEVYDTRLKLVLYYWMAVNSNGNA